MGNGRSRDDFADVLPSTAKDGGGATFSSAKEETPPISEAWTAENSSSAKDVAQIFVPQIVPPSHALQLEECKTKRADDPFEIPESVRKSRTFEAFAAICSEILPGFLYVSNLRVAQNSAKVRSLGITKVINCCGELQKYENGAKLFAQKDPEVQILTLMLRDDANEDLTPFLPQVMAFLANCQHTENKVLIHCHQGVSRSCAIAIAYVMLAQKLSYRESVALVKRQRAIASPNSAFICQLLEWEKNLHAISRKDFTFALHRLSPHSKYDSNLVLKQCFKPSTDCFKQRNVVMMKTFEDENQFLCSQGTFVYQSVSSPIELIVWKGSKCKIPDAITIATQLAAQWLHLHTLVLSSDEILEPMKIVLVTEANGTDFDHFGYDEELQWSVKSTLNGLNLPLPAAEDDIDKMSHSDLEIASKLFVLEGFSEENEILWEEVTNYDSEDLTGENAFLLCSMKVIGGFIWLGMDCVISRENVEEAAQKKIKELQNVPDDKLTVPLVFERQNEESDAFWQQFEAGY